MVQCEACGKDVDMPFRCNYCGGYFCSEHRLPEFHQCSGFQRYQSPAREGMREDFSRAYTFPYSRNLHSKNRFWFSQRELRDLSIGLIVMIALPLVWFGRYVFRDPLFVLASISIFSSAFLFHEIAHKFSAQMMGFWSEFRLNALGLLITLVSLFSPLKIVAPGAVLVSGPLYLSDYGKISLAGPLTNIAMGVLFFVSDLSFNSSITWIGVYINSPLALFNMIPFGMFDGAKIFRWNWRVWVVATLIAGALFFYSSVF
ncbi:hypothetical protein KEJ47_07255 [Candidatus Bathyarchaeota archaeon]|nr:hypothetical protein [Candidatus Bathyarchaeota archaeon]